MTVVLSGCGSSGAAKEVTLRVVAADYGNSAANSSETYWNGLAKEFESKNPGIQVDIDVRSWKTVDADVAKMVRDGEAPDIAQIGAYADYVKKDELYGVDELLSIPTQANFISRFADAGKVEQTQYGMPFVASTRLLFYNKGLFAAAGLSAPKDWDDIRAGAEALKAQDVPTPFALPLGAEEAQAETMMWLLSGGGGYTDPVDGSYAFDSDANVATVKWLQKELVGKGLTGPVAPGELDRADAFEAFADGKVGMLNGHPTLMQEAEKAGVDIGMVPMPGATGRSKATMGVADWIMAFKQPGQREQAGAFLDFAFEDRNVMDFVGQYDLLPVTYSASEAMVTDDQYEELRPFLEALPTSELYPFGKTSWAGVSEDVKKNIGKTVRPGAAPAEILARIGRDATKAENSE
ncbi:extracellular solute-binding protein [Streptomyces sp. NBC_01498]|uniref:ABC transporter substrate-binding protein n=1 Tax=Streptomyces sp. NBC_01498 TaxID=2975870 RepID=UPI002E7C380F|nr:extracellular solute-binding protein [Streptomyces sp. NBC_01498]WTL26192.1 extracellular solute-binding protein [Streptomyces sp. NBC_01498]